MFRREVPSVGDPRDAARWRLLRTLGGHFTGFFIVGVVMFSTQGHLPFWMAIWGAVLAVQTIGTLSKAWPVLLPRVPRTEPVPWAQGWWSPLLRPLPATGGRRPSRRRPSPRRLRGCARSSSVGGQGHPSAY